MKELKNKLFSELLIIACVTTLCQCAPAPTTATTTSSTSTTPITTVYDSIGTYLGIAVYQNGPDFVTTIPNGFYTDFSASGYSPDNYPCMVSGAFNECELSVSTNGFADSLCTVPVIGENVPAPINNSYIFISETGAYLEYVFVGNALQYTQVDQYFYVSGNCSKSGTKVFTLLPGYFSNITATVSASPLATPLVFTTTSN